RGGDDQQEQQRQEARGDPGQGSGVQRTNAQARTREAAVGVFALSSRQTVGRSGARPDHAPDARGVTALVAAAGVGTGLAPLDSLVDALAVGGRLERNPTVVWEVDLHPGVRVLPADDEGVQRGVERAW